eukprot:2958915-Pleurochrysis_carterae.AAC.1
MLRSLIEERHAQADIISRALDAMLSGGPINPKAATALLKYPGVQRALINNHRSRLLSKDNVANADLIAVMTKEHRKKLLALYPDAAGKVHLLQEFAGRPEQDIADPFGGSQENYDATIVEMLPALEAIASKASLTPADGSKQMADKSARRNLQASLSPAVGDSSSTRSSFSKIGVPSTPPPPPQPSPSPAPTSFKSSSASSSAPLQIE